MSELDRDTGWRPASDHGLPDGTMVEVRTLTGVRWLRYIASNGHRSGYTTASLSLTKAESVYEFPGDAEVRPLVPADRPEWVPLTAEQVEHVVQGTTVRVERDGVAITGPFDRIRFHLGGDVAVYLMSRKGQTWSVHGTVHVSPEVADRVIEQADPARKAVSDILESIDASILRDEFFLRLRAAGFDVVPKGER
jgi:hypothetical protein